MRPQERTSSRLPARRNDPLAAATYDAVDTGNRADAGPTDKPGGVKLGRARLLDIRWRA